MASRRSATPPAASTRTGAPESSGSAGPALLPQGQHLGKPGMTLSRPFTLAGSRTRAHLHLVSNTVSKCHAAIVHDEGRVYIRDLSSRTHVYVNGRVVREIELTDGDLLQIGSFTFKLSQPGVIPGTREPAASVLEAGNGEILPLEGRTTTFGRRSTCDIGVDDDSVSTVHAMIFELGGLRYIRDLGSRTGTFVNGTAVHQHPLNFGDRIRIGPMAYRYVAATPETGSFDDMSELEDLVGTARLGHDEQMGFSTATPTPEAEDRRTVSEPGIPHEPSGINPALAAGIGAASLTNGHAARNLAPIPLDDDEVIPLSAPSAQAGMLPPTIGEEIPLVPDDDFDSIPLAEAPSQPRASATPAAPARPALRAPEPPAIPIDLDNEPDVGGLDDTVSLPQAAAAPPRPSRPVTLSQQIEDLPSVVPAPLDAGSPHDQLAADPEDWAGELTPVEDASAPGQWPATAGQPPIADAGEAELADLGLDELPAAGHQPVEEGFFDDPMAGPVDDYAALVVDEQATDESAPADDAAIAAEAETAPAEYATGEYAAVAETAGGYTGASNLSDLDDLGMSSNLIGMTSVVPPTLHAPELASGLDANLESGLDFIDEPSASAEAYAPIEEITGGEELNVDPDGEPVAWEGSGILATASEVSAIGEAAQDPQPLADDQRVELSPPQLELPEPEGESIPSLITEPESEPSADESVATTFASEPEAGEVISSEYTGSETTVDGMLGTMEMTLSGVAGGESEIGLPPVSLAGAEWGISHASALDLTSPLPEEIPQHIPQDPAQWDEPAGEPSMHEAAIPEPGYIVSTELPESPEAGAHPPTPEAVGGEDILPEDFFDDLMEPGADAADDQAEHATDGQAAEHAGNEAGDGSSLEDAFDLDDLLAAPTGEPGQAESTLAEIEPATSTSFDHAQTTDTLPLEADPDATATDVSATDAIEPPGLVDEPPQNAVPAATDTTAPAGPETPAARPTAPAFDPMFLGRDQGSFLGGMPLSFGPMAGAPMPGGPMAGGAMSGGAMPGGITGGGPVGMPPMPQRPMPPARPARPHLPFANKPVTFDTVAETLAEVVAVENESIPMFGAPPVRGAKGTAAFTPMRSDLVPLTPDEDPFAGAMTGRALTPSAPAPELSQPPAPALSPSLLPASAVPALPDAALATPPAVPPMPIAQTPAMPPPPMLPPALPSAAPDAEATFDLEPTPMDASAEAGFTDDHLTTAGSADGGSADVAEPLDLAGESTLHDAEPDLSTEADFELPSLESLEQIEPSAAHAGEPVGDAFDRFLDELEPSSNALTLDEPIDPLASEAQPESIEAQNAEAALEAPHAEPVGEHAPIEAGVVTNADTQTPSDAGLQHEPATDELASDESLAAESGIAEPSTGELHTGERHVGELSSHEPVTHDPIAEAPAFEAQPELTPAEATPTDAPIDLFDEDFDLNELLAEPLASEHAEHPFGEPIAAEHAAEPAASERPADALLTVAETSHDWHPEPEIVEPGLDAGLESVSAEDSGVIDVSPVEYPSAEHLEAAPLPASTSAALESTPETDALTLGLLHALPGPETSAETTLPPETELLPFETSLDDVMSEGFAIGETAPNEAIHAEVPANEGAAAESFIDGESAPNEAIHGEALANDGVSVESFIDGESAPNEAIHAETPANDGIAVESFIGGESAPNEPIQAQTPADDILFGEHTADLPPSAELLVDDGVTVDLADLDSEFGHAAGESIALSPLDEAPSLVELPAVPAEAPVIESIAASVPDDEPLLDVASTEGTSVSDDAAFAALSDSELHAAAISEPDFSPSFEPGPSLDPDGFAFEAESIAAEPLASGAELTSNFDLDPAVAEIGAASIPMDQEPFLPVDLSPTEASAAELLEEPVSIDPEWPELGMSEVVPTETVSIDEGPTPDAVASVTIESVSIDAGSIDVAAIDLGAPGTLDTSVDAPPTPVAIEVASIEPPVDAVATFDIAPQAEIDDDWLAFDIDEIPDVAPTTDTPLKRVTPDQIDLLDAGTEPVTLPESPALDEVPPDLFDEPDAATPAQPAPIHAVPVPIAPGSSSPVHIAPIAAAVAVAAGAVALASPGLAGTDKTATGKSAAAPGASKRPTTPPPARQLRPRTSPVGSPSSRNVPPQAEEMSGGQISDPFGIGGAAVSAAGAAAIAAGASAFGGAPAAGAPIARKLVKPILKAVSKTGKSGPRPVKAIVVKPAAKPPATPAVPPAVAGAAVKSATTKPSAAAPAPSLAGKPAATLKPAGVKPAGTVPGPATAGTAPTGTKPAAVVAAPSVAPLAAKPAAIRPAALASAGAPAKASARPAPATRPTLKRPANDEALFVDPAAADLEAPKPRSAIAKTSAGAARPTPITPSSAARDAFTNTGDAAAPAVPPKSRRRIRVILMIVVLLIMAAAAVTVWMLFRPGSRIRGEIHFNNLNSTDITADARHTFQSQQKSLFSGIQPIRLARTELADAGVSLGFLGEDAANASALDRMLTDARWEDKEDKLVFVRGASTDPGADRIRFLAMLKAMQKVYADHLASLPKDNGPDPAEAQRTDVDARINVLLTERTKAEGRAQTAIEKRTEAERLRGNAEAFRKQLSETTVALAVAQRDYDRLLNSAVPTTRPGSVPPASQPSTVVLTPAEEIDPDLRSLMSSLKDLNESLRRAAESRDAHVAQTKALLDAAQRQFDAQVAAAGVAVNGGSAALGRYVEELQGLQVKLRQLSDEVSQQQKDDRDRLEDFRRKYAKRSATRIQRSWDADTELKAMVGRRGVVERQYNVAVAGSLPEAATLKPELDELSRKIEARRGLIASKDEYDPDVQDMTKFIDDSLKGVEESRKRNEARFNELFASVKVKPDVNNLPAEDKARAAKLEQSYQSLAKSRLDYSAGADAANAAAEGLVRDLTGQVGAQEARIEARRRQLADSRSTETKEKGQAIERQKQAVANLTTQTEKAEAEYHRVDAEALEAAGAQQTLKVIETKLEEARTVRRNLNNAIESKVNAIALVTVGPVSDRSVVVESDADPRWMYTAGVMACGFFLGLMSLVATRSPAPYVPPMLQRAVAEMPQEEHEGYDETPFEGVAEPFSLPSSPQRGGARNDRAIPA